MLFNLEETILNQLNDSYSEIIKKTSNLTWLNLAYWLLTMISIIICFIILFTSFYINSYYDSENKILLFLSLVLVAIFTILTFKFRNDAKILWTFASFIKQHVNKINNYFKNDFLSIYFFLSLFLWFFLLLPLLIEHSTLIKHDMSCWINLTEEKNIFYNDCINQLLSFLYTVVVAQVTLFAIIISYLIGQYSSRIALSILFHRTIISIILFPIAELAIIWLCKFNGFPTCLTAYPGIICTLTIICLLISVIVSLLGTSKEKAITYIGEEFSNEIKKKILKPIVNLQTNKVPWYWNCLTRLKLNFLDQDFIASIKPPIKKLKECEELYVGLFNAANKALKDEQKETFISCLKAIYKITETYSTQRAFYMSSEDYLFDFLENNLSSLSHAAAKSTNESLIEEIGKYQGKIGCLTTKFGKKEVLQRS